MINFIKTDKDYLSLKNHIKFSPHNMLIIGKAGTGKSTLMKKITNEVKTAIILAPTGIAALNAGGKTIHSFFRLNLGFLTKEEIKESINVIKGNDNHLNIIKNMDLLIIDEISMVRADIFVSMDIILRSLRNKDLPFGGVKVILVGDLFQLPPVLTKSETEVFHQFFPSRFFFSTKSFVEGNFVIYELKRYFRQKDLDFIQFLNQIALNGITEEKLTEFSSDKVVDEEIIDYDKRIALCGLRASVKKINMYKLSSINEPEFISYAEIEDDFKLSDNEDNNPADLKLILKKGARVVFIKNDINKSWVNGDLGTVLDYHLNNENKYEILIQKDDGMKVIVTKNTWEAYKYSFQNGKIKKEVSGRFIQIPLKLGWAITIHKSQGLTLENIYLRNNRPMFEHGQLYVALSRCKTEDGIKLYRPLQKKSLKLDQDVVNFYDFIKSNGSLNIFKGNALK